MLAGETVKNGYCTLCRSRCGTLNVIEDGRLVKVRPDTAHPTGAAICMKGKAAPELAHHPDRVLYPMRRTTPKGDADPGWKRMTWDEALDEIACRLGEIRTTHGAESVAFGVTTPSGTPISDSIDWIERFVWSFGSPNICYATEICNWHKDYAHAFTFGCGMPTADYENADVIVLWGTNPANTWLAQADAIGRGRRRGARLVVVDPRPTAFAKQAELWMRVRPGTDAALAMGVARRMIETGHVDWAFVRQWTNAALLVRKDNGRLLRERDVHADAATNRYVVWRQSRQEIAFVDDGDDATTAQDVSLDGRHAVRVSDAAGGATTVECVPAFEHYRQALAPFTPERVEALTGVSAAQVIEVAALLGPGRRIAYHAWSGVGQHRNATQTERAIATLYALTGAFDTRGSNRVYRKLPVNALSDYAGMMPPAQRAKALGLDERPLGPPAQGWVTARDLCRAIVDGAPYPVKALVTFGTNMLVSQADSGATERALTAVDFHVHCDLFETPSSKYADIFLPVNTPWEREGLRAGFEINAHAVEHVQLRPAMIAPLGESRADYDIVAALATRLGMSDAFFGGSIEAGWNHMLAPLCIDVSALRARPEGIAVRLMQRERGYAERCDGRPRGFGTETRRVELYSERLLREGYAPVPQFAAPLARDAAFPLWLTSMKNGFYCHSQHRGIASLRRRAPYSVAELSAELAASREIADGDWILVRTAAGSARFRARVVPELSSEVVVAEYGWWQACDSLGLPAIPVSGADNSNFSNLIASGQLDPVSGSSPLKSTACDVVRDPSCDPARRAWRGLRRFVVASIVEEASGVRAIELAAEDGGALPDYLPGQHVTLHLPTLGDDGTTRAYSLVGPARVDERRSYTIAVRHQRGTASDGSTFEGAMSGHLHRVLAPGDILSLTAPGGTFVLPAQSQRPVVMIAGGIGITPFMSLLETVANGPEDGAPPLWLYYANLDRTTHAFGRRIAGLAARMPSLRVINAYARPGDEPPGHTYQIAGRMSADTIAAELVARRARFYLCGPKPMMDAMIAGLTARGVPSFDIFHEVFRSPVSVPTGESQAFAVRFSRSDKTARWTPEQGTLLSFAEKLGIAMPSGCRVGQCESCAVHVSQGNVRHLTGDGPDEPGICLACQAVPTSELVVDA